MIFQSNYELNRQGRYVAPEKVTGARKVALAALGYKDTGESNTWGKIMNMTPGVTAIGRNALAGALSKDTDTNTVIKAQRGEAFQDSMNGLAVGLESAKLAGTLGLGGAGGSLTGAGNVGSGLLSGLFKGGAGAGAEAVTSGGAELLGNLEKSAVQDQVKSEIAADVEAADVDGLTDYSNYVSMPGNENNMQLNANGGATKFSNAVNKVNNFTSKLPVIGGFVNSIGNAIASGVALNKAGTQEWSNIKKNSVYYDPFSLK